MGVSALDEKGSPIDWFFIYKVPQLGGGPNTDKTTGYEYAYYDSAIDALEPKSRNVLRSQYVLNSDQGALNETLDAVFNSKSKTIGWILYNDERPSDLQGKDNGSLGHTKGVLAFDTASNTGYWLLHSWPKFTEPNMKVDPTPKYGQTYLCLSLTLDALQKIAGQMITHQQPQTYLCQTDTLDKNSPLYKLSQTINPNDPGDTSDLALKTAGGMPFRVIAKNRNWNQDFWNGLVGPALKEDMDVDTWIRGPVAPVADTDGIHKTFDIKYINLGPLGIHVAWPETHDHAKWGITTHSDWICVGDINRMISQRKRGGGTIAFQNDALWRALAKTDLLLAPPGMTRDQARDVVHHTQYDPRDLPGSSPAPEVHTMAHITRQPPTYRGKALPHKPRAGVRKTPARAGKKATPRGKKK